MVGIAIVVIWVAYCCATRGKGEGHESNIPQRTLSETLRLFFIRLLLCFALVGLLAWLTEGGAADIVVQIGSTFVVWTVVLMILLPSWISWATTRLGLVRLSYWFGRMASIRFHRNVHSGGLFRGYQAAQRIRSPEGRKAALIWLKSRSQLKKGVAYSGDMVMSVILDAELQRPGDARHVASRLQLLENLGLASVPGCISMLALKYALAPALAEGRIDLILARARQWDSPGANRIARYVIAWHDAWVLGKPRVSKLRFRILKLSLMRYPVLLRWFDSQRVVGTQTEVVGAGTALQPDTLSAPEALWQASSASLKSKALHEALLAHERIDYFRKRAETLGVWQPEQAIDTLSASVERLSTPANTDHSTERKAGFDKQSSEAEYEAIEEQRKALRFVADAIRMTNQERPKRPGIEQFADWLRLLQILDAMKSSREAQLMAFSSINLVIWSWIVDLWNLNQDRALVHFIAKECAPLAFDSGHEELYKLLHGLLNRVYK